MEEKGKWKDLPSPLSLNPVTSQLEVTAPGYKRKEAGNMWDEVLNVGKTNDRITLAGRWKLGGKTLIYIVLKTDVAQGRAYSSPICLCARIGHVT